MHARYCSPVTGRFLGVDRVEGKPPRPLSWNRYAYALGNPVKNFDPDGNESRHELAFNNDAQAVAEGRMSAAEFKENNQARGTGAVLAVGIVAPGPEDLVIAAAASKLAGWVGGSILRKSLW